MFTTTTSPELSQKYSPEMTDEDIELLLCHLRPAAASTCADQSPSGVDHVRAAPLFVTADASAYSRLHYVSPS